MQKALKNKKNAFLPDYLITDETFSAKMIHFKGSWQKVFVQGYTCTSNMYPSYHLT